MYTRPNTTLIPIKIYENNLYTLLVNPTRRKKRQKMFFYGSIKTETSIIYRKKNAVFYAYLVIFHTYYNGKCSNIIFNGW